MRKTYVQNERERERGGGGGGGGSMTREAKRGGFWFSSLISGEVRSVEAAMRINSRWSVVLPSAYGLPSAANAGTSSSGMGMPMSATTAPPGAADEYGEAEGEHLVCSLRRLRKQASSWGRSRVSSRDVAPLLYLRPFLDVIRSEETNGPITGMALNSLHKLLTLHLFDAKTKFAKEAVDATVTAVTQCRFEATDPASDEVVLSKILNVLLDCARCDAARLLSDRNVCDMVQACFRIGHQTGREGELLQRMARTYMIEIVRQVFSTLVDGLGEEATRTRGAIAGANAAEIDVDEGCCGLASAVEIFQFGTSLFSADVREGRNIAGGFDEEMSVFGLMMISTVMECIGPVLESYPALLVIAKDDLMRALLSCRSSSSVLVLSLTCSVFLSLYIHVRQHLVVQLESFVHGVLLRLGEGRGFGSADQQIIALEAISDLCRHPLFTLDLYATYDCAVESGNLFEEMCSVLSKTAFPVNVPLSRLHMLALDGLIAIVSGMAERCRPAAALEDALDADAEENGDEMPAATSPSSMAAALPGQDENMLGGGADGSLGDFKEYTPVVWAEISSGPGIDRGSSLSPDASAFLSRRQKFIKRRLLVAIDHFNRKPKKGLEFLQHIHLLPDPLDAGAVASFLRMTPGLDKSLIGEYLGDPGEFQIEVLRLFTSMFDFGHMELDMAMRSYLTSFRLPGEAQKISRILEAFADIFHAQSKAANAGGPGEAWSCAKNADAIYVLSYSVIMLNTDLHNDQVKNKMTLDAFVRNNRGTNEGEDWPREVLHQIYDSIEKYEIRMKDDGDALDITPGQWAAKLRRAETKQLNLFNENAEEGGAVYSTGDCCTPFDRDMFAIFWGPTIAALSVVFDHAEDEAVLEEAVDGFMCVAKVAAYHNFIDVMDNLVISLCKFSALLNPTALKPAVTFGNDDKARVAVVCVFSLAHRYGDCIRNGWRNILDLVIRMHKLNILDYAEDDDDKKGSAPGEEAATHADNGAASNNGDFSRAAEAGAEARRRSSSIVAGVSRKSHEAVRARTDIQKSSSLTTYMASTLSRAFGLSSDDSERGDGGGNSGAKSGDASARNDDYEAERRTFKCVEDCHIDDIFTESKFLETESLFQLVRALIWAGGMTSATAAAAGGGASGGSGGAGASGSSSGGAVSNGAVVDEDTTVFCLGLLMTITLRNRDRIRHIWDVVHEHLSMIILTASSTTPLVEVAVIELLRLCQRLLPYKEEIAEKLLVSLQLVLKLNEQVAFDLAQAIMNEVVTMLKGSVAHIHSADGWRTLLILVLKTSRHPDAAALSFEALTIICSSDAETRGDGSSPDTNGETASPSTSFLTPESFTICLDALISFVDSSEGGADRSIGALEMMTPLHGRLVEWYTTGAAEPKHVVLLWEKLVGSVAEFCADTRADVRDAAVVLLARALACADALGLSVESWTGAFENIVFPLLDHLMKAVRARGQKQIAHAPRTLRAAVALMCKAFLQPTLSSSSAAYTSTEAFGKLWMRILAVLVDCHKVASAMKEDKNAASAASSDSDGGEKPPSAKEELLDAVTEAAKNCILVLASQDILVKGSDMWRDSFRAASTISPSLTEELLFGGSVDE